MRLNILADGKCGGFEVPCNPPGKRTHSQLNPNELAEQGIKPDTIRLSIGTEHIQGIIAYLEQAFGR